MTTSPKSYLKQPRRRFLRRSVTSHYLISCTPRLTIFAAMPPKKDGTQRRASGSASKVAAPASAEKASKSSKPSQIIRLKLPKATLAGFPHEPTPSKSMPKKKSPLSTSTLAAPSDPPPQDEPSKESEVTTSPPVVKPETSSGESPTKKEPSSPKTGMKRELGAGVEEPVKVRARPGPKKKPRAYVFDPHLAPCSPCPRLADSSCSGDGTILHTKPKGPAPGPNHKLGPKANQGAINAGLRALDRSGTPCRKWTKSGFHLKTFTGVTWEIPSWRAPKTMTLDGQSDLSKSSTTSNSQGKVDPSNSNGGSEKSASGDVDMTSSPAPAAAEIA